MHTIICPIDGKPCAPDCSDRFTDREEGGCILTLAKELGAKLLPLGNGGFAMIFTPGGGETL